MAFRGSSFGLRILELDFRSFCWWCSVWPFPGLHSEIPSLCAMALDLFSATPVAGQDYNRASDFWVGIPGRSTVSLKLHPILLQRYPGETSSQACQSDPFSPLGGQAEEHRLERPWHSRLWHARKPFCQGTNIRDCFSVTKASPPLAPPGPLVASVQGLVDECTYYPQANCVLPAHTLPYT